MRDQGIDTDATCLIADAKAGSVSAMDGLIALLADQLRAELGGRRLRGLSPSRSGSDLIQETVIRAREKFHCFSGHTFAEFKQWARGILYLRRRHWMRNHRDRTNSRKMERIWLAVARKRNLPDESSRPSEDWLERREEAEKAFAAFLRLKPHEQYIVNLRVVDGLAFKQIALIVNSTEGTVARACNRAIKRLGRYFELNDKR